MLIEPKKSHLLLIDIQEKLANIINNRDEVEKNARILVASANELAIPVTMSEQYPQGLGPALPDLAEAAPEAPMAKNEFSCARNCEIAARLSRVGASQIVIAGIEAHICVLQSALDLSRDGLEVYVVADAIGSRTARSHELALRRMAASGVHIVTTEMVVFEWLQTADSPSFKAMSRLIR